jgi:hypothetical protein
MPPRARSGAPRPTRSIWAAASAARSCIWRGAGRTPPSPGSRSAPDRPPWPAASPPGAGLADRCRFLAADFLDPSAGIAAADLAVAIESAVHAPSAAAFARAAAARLRPGGVLVVVDDMLARTEADLAPRHAALVAQFRRGWHLGHVATADETIAAAGRAGLAPCAAHDLTGLLRLDRLRDRLLRPIGPLAARLRLESVPLFANMIGGNALTCAYRAGIMRYRLLAFRKAAP